ncbi:MAG TPA: HYR domain-containing protein, partial [Verrucomicrobiae bacterium]|nr:HYR domain-containing protein [Verrucomicrobiae bacterium]
TCQFTVTVNDNTPPVVTCPANITVGAAPGRCDTAIFFNVTPTDNCPGATVSCVPPSGTLFHVGTTTVTCIASDASGNKDTCQFTITVNDNQPPAVTCPANISVNAAAGQCAASVSYNASASDNCGPPITPAVSLACNPSSGSSFPVGTTTVTCIATDGAGNKDTCQFTVTVNDNQPPAVVCPANITVNNAPGVCEATVNYQPPAGSDNCSGPVTVVCAPPPGSVFPVGTSFVQCVATDGAGNKDTCEFTVTVNDTEKPTVTCPANMTVSHSPGNCSNVVNYPPPATSDNCAGPVSVVCTPPAGSVFQFGTTTVTCVATDGAGNQESCSFTVTITNQPPIVTARDTSVFNCPGNEICLQVSATDPDAGDIITVEKVSGPGTFTPVTGPTPVNAQFCFTPTSNVPYVFVFKVTNSCGAVDYDTASVNVLCLPPPPPTGPCLSLEIGDITAFLGSDVEVPVVNPIQFVDSSTLPNPSGIGGFSFLISYDCACLQFLSARKGALLVQQGWEFFTYRYGAIGNGNCGSGCPSCLLRIVAIADINNGAAHPNLTRDNSGEWVVLKFRVSNDRALNGMCCPINWYWFDCTDNTVSDSTGNVTWVAQGLFTPDGDPVNLATEFPSDISICDQSSGGPGKPSPKKLICFRNGRICIPFDTDIDDRGDLNLNGAAYDVGDAVLFENYFIYGSGVLSANPTQRQAQIAASDVNGDGISLSVGDLVALIRVLTGDAAPLPNKVVPISAGVDLSWSLSGRELKITTTSGSELGGLFVHFKYSGTAEKTLSLLTASEGMQPKVNAENGELRILIDSDQRGARLPAGEVSFTVPVDGTVEFVEAQASNYNGQILPVVVKAAVLPTQFALSQNYPNPFNPKTNFTLSLPTPGRYKITIYNLLGEAVRVFEGEAPAGYQVFTWDGTDGRGRPVSSGLYLYKAEVGRQVITKKMMLMR